MLQYLIKRLVSDGYLVKKTTPQGVPIKGHYAFNNNIIQKVAYSRLLFLQRQKLHRVIAEYLEQSHDEEERRVLAAVLAHHWTQVLDGAVDPAREVLEKALSFLSMAYQARKANNQDTADIVETASRIAEKFKDKKQQEKAMKVFR